MGTVLTVTSSNNASMYPHGVNGQIDLTRKVSRFSQSPVPIATERSATPPPNSVPLKSPSESPIERIANRLPPVLSMIICEPQPPPQAKQSELTHTPDDPTPNSGGLAINDVVSKV